MATVSNAYLNQMPVPGGKGTMTIVGRLAERDEILVVSVPPTGATMFYCQAHDILFGIKDVCHECAGKHGHGKHN